MADSWEDLPDVKGSDDWEKLPDVKPTAPPGKVPSPTGWRDAPKGKLDKSILAHPEDWERDMERQNEAMFGALASGAHGAANAMEGPINGAIAGATTPPINANGPTGWDDIVKRYTAERDRVQGAQKENLERFPHAPLVGAVLAGGAGQAPSRAGRLAMGGLQGLAYGIGSSKHNLTDGEVAPLAKDAAVGTGFGVAGAGAGELLNAGAGAVANKLGGVLDKNRAAAQSLKDAAMRSAIGSHGGDVSAGSNQLKMLRDALTDPNVEPEVRRAAEEFLASAEGKTLLNQVLRSNLSRAEGQVGRIAASRAAMTDAIEDTAPEAVEKAAQARLDDPSALLRRLRELLPKVVLPAVGGGLAGPGGAAAGAFAASVLGRGATTARNALTDPYVSSRILGSGTNALTAGGNAMSHAAPPLAEWSKFIGEEDKEQP